MPDLGELVGGVVRFLGDSLSASRLAVGVGPTLALLTVMLVLLYLLARPTARWRGRDLGRLQGVVRTMALAAESGGTASFSLGTAGVVRPAAAVDRLQTLAALPVLGHVASAAARGGVPLMVTANDAVAVELARAVLDEAFAATSTSERARRARAEHVGDGRASAAGRSLARPAGAGNTTHVLGGLSEEAPALLTGEVDGAATTTFGTATPAEAVWVLLLGQGAVIGPELYSAASAVLPATDERAAVFAVNRLIWVALALLAGGSLLRVLGIFDVAGFVLGRS
ncbi:MAG: DUF6754 domain-containing protein [Candidatus Limnocylindria bacterium]